MFYTYCYRKDYLEISKSSLLTIVEKYILDETHLSTFLINFLTELSLKDLRAFSDLAKSLERKTGINGSDQQKVFFSTYPEALWLKYRNWLNLIHINEYFGNDERSRYWSKYQFENVKHYTFSNSVAMQTSKYYIIEFLGKAMGPMYVYPKDLYDSKIRYWMQGSSNADLRQQLYHSGNYTKRITHQGDWQAEFDWYIKINNITTRIAD